jgi:protein ImuB
MVLSAPIAETLAAVQIALRRGFDAKGGDADDLAALVDRLGSRLGLANLCRLAPCESHLPERAVAVLPAVGSPTKSPRTWPAGTARPVRLLNQPEPVEAMAPVPDDPPLMFRWRRLLHRVRRADGPERVAGEWWRDFGRGVAAGDPDDIRDYYRVEDEAGRRFWLYRAGLFHPDRAARWFVHGVFA